MALSARIPSTILTNKFIPEIYLNQVIDAAKSNLVNLDAVNTEWTAGKLKGNVFYITKTNIVTASEVVVNTKGSALNPFNTTGVTVTMNQWFQAPIDIDDMSEWQSHIAVEAYAVKESAYAIALAIDTYVSSFYSTLNADTVLGSDGSAITDDILITAMETLDEADAKRDGGRSLILDPSGVADMMKFDKFVSADYVSLGAVANGVIGKNHPIYGCTVRVTNNLTAATTGNYQVMLHKDAIAAKVQMENAWVWAYKDLHTTRYHSEALYGVSEAQDAFGIPFYSRKK